VKFTLANATATVVAFELNFSQNSVSDCARVNQDLIRSRF